MRRADRLFQIVQYLRGRRLTTAAQLADWLEISQRTVYRDIQDLEPLLDKWRSFGFAVAEIDGHDVGGLSRLCRKLPFANDKPAAIICHTVKGRGIPFAENNPKWHHHSRFQPAELAAIDAALGDRP